MAWPTPAQVVNAAAQELGLVSWASPISDPFASTDKNVQQMNALLQRVGQELVRQHSWSQMQVEGSISTVSGVASYPLPSGFLRFIDQTQWDRTNQLPMPSTGPQGWQQLKARTAGGLVNKVMRIYGGAIHFYETPTAAESICFEYQTRFWVRDTIPAWATTTAYEEEDLIHNSEGYVYECRQAGISGAPGPIGPNNVANDGTVDWTYLYPSVDAAPPTAETSDTATDYLLFDFRLLVDGLKLYFKRAKGLDTTSEQQAYDATLSAVLGGDGVAPVLSLNPGGSALIGPGNAPEGGYG